MIRTRGFTLIELLVAVSLFAIVSVMAFGGLSAMLRQSDVLGQKVSETEALVRSLALLRRDLEAAVPQTLAPTEGGEDAVQVLANGFSLVRSGAPHLPFGNDDGFVRVDWLVKGSTLIRRHHAGTASQTVTEQPMLTDVEALSLGFLTGSTPKTLPAGGLPPAFEVHLMHRLIGPIRLVVTR